MKLLKRNIGLGTMSIILCIIGIAWSWNFNYVCYGDIILNFLGLKAWTNGTNGTHLTVIYSLVFFVPAFILGSRFKHDFGARVGKIISLVLGLFCLMLLVFGLSF